MAKIVNGIEYPDVDGEWHKILSIVLLKLGYDKITITTEDVDRLAKCGFSGLCMKDRSDPIELFFVRPSEEEKLIQEEKAIEVSHRSGH